MTGSSTRGVVQASRAPVEVRAKLTKRDKLRIATVENVQRKNLVPVDEAEAFAEPVRKAT